MAFLDYVFPRWCCGCGAFGRYFCGDCQKSILSIGLNETICPVCERPAVAGFTHPRCRTRYTPDGLTSFFHYEGVIQKAVKTLKYRFVSDIAREFISLIPDAALVSLSGACLMPIPLHPARLRHRGFNQSEVLGRLIARQLHIPLVVDILRRDRMTRPQAEMADRKARLRNMHGVFVARKSPFLDVILFDDVFTTGATVRAAGAALKKAGAKSVWIVTMAR